MSSSPDTTDKQTTQPPVIGSNRLKAEQKYHKNGNTKNNSAPNATDAIEVTIIHFNDCYNVEAGPESSGAAGFLTAVNQFRHLDPMILFSGDIISPSFLSTFTKGEQMIPVLNDIGVHCAVFGNHEFDYGVDNLIDFCKKTTFPWLLSNVIDRETCNQLGEGLIYHIIERKGLRFGLIGLIEEEWLSTLSTIDPSDMIYQDFVTRGRELARLLKSDPHRVDYVIALTHFRTPNDIMLADSVPDIDLILGGHDHDYEVIKRPNCYIVKSGTDFREFSRITLKINPTDRPTSETNHSDNTVNSIINESSNLIDIAPNVSSGGSVGQSSQACFKDAKSLKEIEIQRVECIKYEPDEGLKKKLEKFVTTIDEKMSKVLGQFNCDLDGRFSSIRRGETNLGNFVTDIMLASTHADLAILNSGTLRSNRIHPSGNFTMRDLFNILGFIDPIAVLEATGRQIWKALENGVSQWPKLEGRFPQISGCSFAFDPEKPPQQRINPDDIMIGEEQLDLGKLYKLTTKAYLASGKDGYDVLKECRVLVPGDESPDLTTSILNHFEAINIVKSNRRTHHRQSIICLSRSSIKKLLDHTPISAVETLSPNANCVTSNPPSSITNKNSSFDTNHQPDDLRNNSTFEEIAITRVNLNHKLTAVHSADPSPRILSEAEEEEEEFEANQQQDSDQMDNYKNQQFTVSPHSREHQNYNQILRHRSNESAQQIRPVSQSISTQQDANNNVDDSDSLNQSPKETNAPIAHRHQRQNTVKKGQKTSSIDCEDKEGASVVDSIDIASSRTCGSNGQTRPHSMVVTPARPRTKRMMSIYEMEYEMCKLEPRTEGRIRVLSADS